MQLNAYFVQVLPCLREIGDMEQARGTLDIADIDIGHRHFEVPGGIAFDANLVNTGEAVLLSGTASAELDTNCDRCLEPVRLCLTGEIQGYFLFDRESVKDGERLEEYEAVDRKGRVDIAPSVLAAIVFEIPTVTLCRADCPGIAREAAEDEPGAADGEEAGTSEADGVNPLSPFAVLKDFEFEDQARVQE